MNLSQTDSLESKLQFISFIKSVFIPLLLFIYYSCSQIPEEKGSCMLNCNPAECLILDEEKCECLTDFDCIREKYYGVNLGECMEEDGGSWCSALTGDSAKTWEFVYAYDTIRNDTLINVFGYGWNFPNGFQQYRSDMLYFNDDSFHNNIYHDYDVYFWKFDNLIQPTKIIYERWYRPPYNIKHEFERTIIKLNPDTLITTWLEGEFPGWIVLVPKIKN